MAKNPQNDKPKAVDSPASGSIAVTPDDNNNLAFSCRAISIGGVAGTVKWTGWDDVVYTTKILPVGTHPMLAKRIWSAGTTATEITAWI
jgi:hypothetical protein